MGWSTAWEKKRKTSINQLYHTFGRFGSTAAEAVPVEIYKAKTTGWLMQIVMIPTYLVNFRGSCKSVYESFTKEGAWTEKIKNFGKSIMWPVIWTAGSYFVL